MDIEEIGEIYDVDYKNTCNLKKLTYKSKLCFSKGVG